MKKKSLLIICFSILALLFSIGGALWLAPINIGSQSGKPTHTTKEILSPIIAPKIEDFYYTEGSLTEFLYDNTMQDESDYTFTDGSWSVDYTGSTPLKDLVGDSSAISVSVTATYTPDNTAEYEIYSTTLSANVLAVAKYNNKFYATIDKALSVANAANSGTVYSLPANKNSIGVYNHANQEEARTISTTTEINTEVTLALPYDSAALDATVSYVFMTETDYKVSSYNNALYQANLIYFAENLTLSNYGTINVAGEVCGGGGGNYAVNTDYANSITAGRHGQINLKSSATLKNYGTLNCYGFINETTPGNASQVILEDKSTATVMFSIVEHRGGLAYFGMLNPSEDPAYSDLLSAAIAGLRGKGQYTPNVLQTSPFNRFFIASITSKIVAKYNATMKGHVVLCAGADAEVGFDGNNITVVNLVNSSDALITLQSKNGYLEAKYDYSSHITDLDIYGDMTLNPLGLPLTVSKKAMGMTTTIELTLSTGPVDGSDGIFFPICDYYDVSLNPTKDENNNIIPASVNTMKQNIKLLPGSKLTIDEGVSVTAKSIVVYDSNRLLIEGHDVHYTTATPAELIVNGSLSVQNLGGKVKSNRASASLTIEASNSLLSNEIKSIGAIAYVEYNLVVATFSMPYSPITYFSASESTLTANGATPSGSSNLSIGNYTSNSSNAWVSNNASFALNYVFVDENGNRLEGVTNSNPSTYTIATNTSFAIPSYSADPNLQFTHWYLDESLDESQRIDTLSGRDIWNKYKGNATIYGKFAQVETYNIVLNYKNPSNYSDVPTSASTYQNVVNDPFNPNNISSSMANKYTDKAYDYQYYFAGWYDNESYTGNPITTVNSSEKTTVNLYAKWVQKLTVTINATAGSKADPQFTVSFSRGNESLGTTATLGVGTYYYYVLSGDKVTITAINTLSEGAGTNTITANKSITVKGENSGTCLAAGTLITLADGSKKAVEDLRKGNMVMAFDHLTGQIVYSRVIIVVKTQSAYYKNTFVFDDGTKLATINEHGIFDLNLNKYVNISHENYHEFIGHDFVAIDTQGNITTKKLVNVISEYEDDGYKYDIVSDGTLNYVAEDTLSVTHVLVDVINTFDFGDNLVYDSAKMQADIEFYGLYTYDEWEEYCDISVFNEYNIPVMKVGIEKGLYTKEYIIGLINQFVLNENNQIV